MFSRRVVVLLLLLGLTQAKGEHDILDQCAKENNIDDARVEKFRNREEPDESMMCFFKCMAEKSGIIRNGELDKEMAKQMVYYGRFKPECLDEDFKIESCEDMNKMKRCSVHS